MRKCFSSQLSIQSLSLALGVWLLSAGLSSAAPPQAAATNPVLPQIEKFKAPPYPKSLYVQKETYDYRIASNRPVPATLTDTFICDIWQRITMDLKLTITRQETTDAIVQQAMQIYLNRKWEDIAGYRPWTHANFIRKLTAANRAQLAKEVAAYILEHGVRDVE